MMRLSFSQLLVYSITAAALAPLYGEVTVNPLFADGAVLQRGQSLPVWGTARDGEKVIVTSAKVAEPKAVSYNWANIPEGNLFNRDGLPAAPFRSDQPAATNR